MGMPYRARVNERTLLNLPGFHGGAFVHVFVENTSKRELLGLSTGDPDDLLNFEPIMYVEIADCTRIIQLKFDIDTHEGRANSLHKLDTLLSALSTFRACLVKEFKPYDKRDRELEELRQ